MNSTHIHAATCGTLYGLGVGPGAPDLITLRAVSILHRVDVILAAASPRNEHSLALSIATPHLPEGVEVVRLDFPMTRDKAVLQEAWQRNAARTAALLQAGKNAAFLTLGDPLIYSTFGYLTRSLLQIYPEMPIEVVPGITSFQAAAAASNTVLCEGAESLLLISGINNEAELRAGLEATDNAAILKCYKNFPAIRATLLQHEQQANGKGKEAKFTSRLGLEGEILAESLQKAPDAPHYLSLVLATAKRK